MSHGHKFIKVDKVEVGKAAPVVSKVNNKVAKSDGLDELGVKHPKLKETELDVNTLRKELDIDGPAGGKAELTEIPSGLGMSKGKNEQFSKPMSNLNIHVTYLKRTMNMH